MINPSHPLYDAELQTRNAKRRLGNLKGSITRFRRKSATSLGRITEVDGRPVKVYQWPPPAPDLWGTILSDFANSLRSTLNYIAWELAVENMRKTGQSRKPSDQTQFPICDRPDNYQHRNTRRQIADILPEAIPEIERVQPYNKGNQPNNYLLSVLRELNNPMKHRFIIQLNSVARITGLPYVKTALRLSLKDNKPELITQTPGDAPTLQPNLGPHVTFPISFETPDISPSEYDITVLDDIYLFVNKAIIPRFTGFFQ